MSVLVSGGAGSGSRAGASLRAFRNRIINGDFAVDQRNAGAAETINAAANNYALDRWAGFGTAAAGTFYLQQTFNSAVSDVYYMAMSCNGADASLAAGDLYAVSQFIEGNNVYDLVWGTASAKAVTLSFEVYSNITGTFAVSVRNGVNNRSWLGSYTINAAGAWERKTVTIPGDTSGTWLTTIGVGMGVTFTLAGGSTFQGAAGWQAGNLYTLAGMTNLMSAASRYILLRKVQLEAGSTATEFERVPYDVQLMRCQRYYQKYGPIVLAYGGAGVIEEYPVSFAVPMRTTPTGAVVGTWTAVNCSQPALNVPDGNTFSHAVTVTALGQFQSYPNSADDSFTFDAEL